MAKQLHALPLRKMRLTGSASGAELAVSKQLEGCFSVMSFNMLAQCYTRSEYFPSVNPKAALKWKNRGPMIINEIIQYTPDIVCLQECDDWHDFVAPEMERHGYLGVIKVKTDGKKDGVAVLWRKDKFVFRSSDSIEYGIRSGVGLVVCLSPVTTPGIAPEQQGENGNISIANTHLF